MRAERYDLPVSYDMHGGPIVRLRGITKVFYTATGDATVLRDVSVDVQQGEFVSVVGRSGSGKTTLVNMVTGIDRPTSGQVEVGGVRTDVLPESPMALWRGRNLGIVFQFFQLLPMLTLIENVMLPMDFCNVYPSSSREGRALDLLARVGLRDQARALPGAVAGGQQQSAAIARALANDPPIIVADEPTGNLDSHTAGLTMDLFEELVAGGKTILMVTHDRELARRSSRILLISDGQLANVAIAAALPGLPEEVLLRLSGLAMPVTLRPGEVPSAASPIPVGHSETVYIVQVGTVQSRRPFRAEPWGPGSIVDPRVVDLVAGETGAELLALPRQEVLAYLASPEGAQPRESRQGAWHWWPRRRAAS